MASKNSNRIPLTFHPLTKDRWKDFELLFGKRGACGGCWCMWFRLTRAEFNRLKNEGNRKAMKKIVNSGEVPGILAYDNEKAVGWCSVEPRDVFPVLDRSRVLKRVDDKPVWSIVCFFTEKSYRRKGVTVALIEEAVRYARKRGASIVEGYPIEPKKGTYPDTFAYVGLVSAFKKAGFKEVLRRSDTRPIMRKLLIPRSTKRKITRG